MSWVAAKMVRNSAPTRNSAPSPAILTSPTSSTSTERYADEKRESKGIGEKERERAGEANEREGKKARTVRERKGKFEGWKEEGKGGRETWGTKKRARASEREERDSSNLSLCGEKGRWAAYTVDIYPDNVYVAV